MREIEKWKPINGFESLYLVSDHGNVFSLIKKAVLKPKAKTYCEVCLCKDGKKYYRLIHRLVATAFLENPNGYPCINHKDENKHNNYYKNLEWCTPKYNNAYGNHIKSAMSPVLQFDYNGKFMREWESIKEAAEYYGIKYQGICRCCRHERKHCFGFMWEYAKTPRKWKNKHE